MRISLALLALALLVASAGPLAARDRDDRTEMQGEARSAAAAGGPETLVVDGLERSYRLHRSAHPRAAAGPLPTVVVLHGRLGTGRQIRRHLAMDELADREGFHLAYPDGLNRSWNDGRPDSARIKPVGKDAGEAPPDDLAFLAALMDRLVAEGLADPARIFVTGPSNGGMMTLRVGCALAERVAAIAPLIANMPEELGAASPGSCAAFWAKPTTTSRPARCCGGSFGGRGWSEVGFVFTLYTQIRIYNVNTTLLVGDAIMAGSPREMVPQSETINLRASAEQKALIDRAAARLGKTRTEFMLESAREAAESALLDERLFLLDEADYDAFTACLDAPVEPTESLRQLLTTPSPWER